MLIVLFPKAALPREREGGRVVQRRRMRRIPPMRDPPDPQGSRCPPSRRAASRVDSTALLWHGGGTGLWECSGAVVKHQGFPCGRHADEIGRSACLPAAAAAGDDDGGVSAGWIGVTAAAVGAVLIAAIILVVVRKKKTDDMKDKKDKKTSGSGESVSFAVMKQR